jgi:hypothetical protein
MEAQRRDSAEGRTAEKETVVKSSFPVYANLLRRDAARASLKQKKLGL